MFSVNVQKKYCFVQQLCRFSIIFLAEKNRDLNMDNLPKQ